MSGSVKAKKTAESGTEPGGASSGGESIQAKTDVRDWQLLKRLWVFMRPYRGLFLISLALLPIVSALNLVQPHLIQLAVDDHITPGKLDGLGTIALLFGGALVGGFLVQFGQFYIMQTVGQRALRDMRKTVYDHLLRLRLSYFHKTPTGRVMTRVTSDIESLQEAFSSGMVTILGDLIALAAIIVILLVKDWQLALVTFAIVPLLVLITVVFRRLMRGAFRAVRLAVANANSFLQESVSGMRVVQLFVQERRMGREYERRAAALRDSSFAAIKWDATFYALIEAISSIAIALIIWYGAGGALEGVITLGLLISFVEYVEKFFRPIRDLTQKYALLQSAMASSERIFELLDNDDLLDEADDAKSMTSIEHKIEFRGVWFSYDDRAATAPDDPDIDWVLSDVSFTLPVGSRFAVVGHTGAGKSTLTRLLTRLYDVQKGAILVDGVDIRELELASLRRLFTVVHQDVFLFTGSVMDNITLGREDLDDESAFAASRAVQAHGFIEARGGYEREVMEGGSNLSAGERQLVSFARALAAKPEVLILDEATASVDPETEHALQTATSSMLERQTSVVIAHRLSTIRSCDQILVMHHGELREQGSHEELIELGGLYETLYRLQYSRASDGPGASGAA